MRDSGQAYNQHTKSYSRTEGSQRKGASSHIQVYTAYRKYSTTTRGASIRGEWCTDEGYDQTEGLHVCFRVCVVCSRVACPGLRFCGHIFRKPLYLDFNMPNLSLFSFHFLPKKLPCTKFCSLASTFLRDAVCSPADRLARGASAPHAGHDDRLAQRQGVPRPFC